MRKIHINLFDYKGQFVKSILSDWPHYRVDDFILDNMIKYRINRIITDIQDKTVYVDTFATTE